MEHQPLQAMLPSYLYKMLLTLLETHGQLLVSVTTSGPRLTCTVQTEYQVRPALFLTLWGLSPRLDSTLNYECTLTSSRVIKQISEEAGCSEQSPTPTRNSCTLKTSVGQPESPILEFSTPQDMPQYRKTYKRPRLN